MRHHLTLGLSYLGYLLLMPVLPLIIWQGKNTRKTALRLPEAEGPRSGEFSATSQQTFRVLHLGESTVAGVGVKHSDLGFTANISKTLQAFNIGHQWQYIAQTGIDTGELIALLNQQSTIPECTHLIITMGVNDTTGFSRRPHWRDNLMTLAEHIRNNNPAVKIYFTQVPPMQKFPALAKPLNYFLGLRAWQLNRELMDLCAENDWRFIAMELPLQPQWMAEDGYHPNADGYQLWGEGVAKIMAGK